MTTGMPSLQSLVLPNTSRDGDIAQLQLASSWESQFHGIGRLTSFTTVRLLRESFGIDDIALYIVVLQRHRVELGLKLVIERTGQKIRGIHKIDELLDDARAACTAVGKAAEFAVFEAAQKEFIDLMHSVDPTSTVYRYPVDRNGLPFLREPYLDIEELEEAGISCQDDVYILLEELADRDPVPVDASDAPAAIDALCRLADGCNNLSQGNAALLGALRAHFDSFGIPRSPDTASMGHTVEASDEAARVAEFLGLRARRVAKRIADANGLQLPAPTAAAMPPTFPAAPPTTDVPSMATHMDNIITTVATATHALFAPLTSAVVDVETLCAGWTTPYYAQLRVDLERYRSRLLRTQ